MSYPLEYSIRERLAAYLASQMTLSEFEDWFFPETWDIDQVGNLDLLNLVYGIKLRLAEFSNGDWTEAELHSQLRPFIERYIMAAPQNQIQYGTSSTTLIVQLVTSFVGQSADRRSSTVYG